MLWTIPCMILVMVMTVTAINIICSRASLSFNGSLYCFHDIVYENIFDSVCPGFVVVVVV